MLSEERYKVIENLLKEESIVKTHVLCELFQTTRETVRRDLMVLEEKGLLKRIHGGAIRVDAKNTEKSIPLSYQSFEERQQSGVAKKDIIVHKAIEFIKDGSVIALDSGTTALRLATLLKGKFKALTVVTNSLPIANELAGVPGIDLIMTGGIYKSDEKAFLSELAGMLFDKIRIDTFFLTTCGISVDAGITYQRMDEIPVQTKMMGASDMTIAIADSSKLGVNSLVRMCGIEAVTRLITDEGITESQKEEFEQAGVVVTIAIERSAS